MKQYNGFTIIEVTITISIVSIIFVLAANFMLDSMKSQRYLSEQNDAIVESRKAIARITSELREAVSADTGAYPLELLDDQEIIFFSDVDEDTYTERVRYFLEGTLLKRGMTEPTTDAVTLAISYDTTTESVTTLAYYVQNDTDPLFYYYNEDYPSDSVTNPLATPANASLTRMVKIHVETNVDPNRIPDTRDLDSYIQLRNLKENF